MVNGVSRGVGSPDRLIWSHGSKATLKETTNKIEVRVFGFFTLGAPVCFESSKGNKFKPSKELINWAAL
eukprot:5912954-Ditylum_brightwellii.AAC.1